MTAPGQMMDTTIADSDARILAGRASEATDDRPEPDRASFRLSRFPMQDETLGDGAPRYASVSPTLRSRRSAATASSAPCEGTREWIGGSIDRSRP